MSGLFARVISWFAEEIIVKTLSRSRRFQHFALRTDDFVTKQKKTLEEHAKKMPANLDAIMKEAKNMSKNNSQQVFSAKKPSAKR